MTFSHPIGIELTAIPKRFEQRYGDELEQQPWYHGQHGTHYLINNHKDLKRSLDEHRISCYSWRLDQHCVEVASPIMHDMASLERWSMKTRTYFDRLGCAPKHPQTVCGGSHIHVGGLSTTMKKRIMKDMIMRPYLPWIFGEPDEAEAMDVWIGEADVVQKFLIQPWVYFDTSTVFVDNSFGVPYQYSDATTCKALAWALGSYPVDNDKDLRCWFNDKSRMVSWSIEHPTIEFRFMEMTETWEEEQLQVEFILAYIDWIKIHQAQTVKLLSYNAMQKIKPEQCLDQFNEMCYNIGVDADDYKPFVKRNLYPRWQLGRKR